MGENGQLFGWSEEWWLFLDQYGILLGDLITTLTLILAAVGYLNREAIRRWITHNRFPAVGGTAAAAASWDAIVFTLSHPDVPQWVMQQARPKIIGILATEQSRAAADEVRAAAKGLGIRVAGVLTLHEPDDPREAKRLVAHLIQLAAEQEAEHLAVDITGGKTTMSLGAFMAAEEAGAATLYVSTKYDETLRRPDMRTAHIRCISSPR